MTKKECTRISFYWQVSYTLVYMSKKINVLTNKSQRFVFSTIVVVGVVFIFGLQNATGYCSGVFGNGPEVECSALVAGFESVLGWVAFSGYFALLPVVIPILVVWGIVELLTRATHRTSKN